MFYFLSPQKAINLINAQLLRVTSLLLLILIIMCNCYLEVRYTL